MDPRDYRTAIGHFATGVAVVTTPGPAGATTNAVTSLSLDPLLLLVCFEDTSRTLTHVRDTGRFAVNVLTKDQEDVARTFASKREMDEKFARVGHTDHDGLPVLDDTIAWLACDLHALHDGGDHTIAVGHVRDGAYDTTSDPLLFFRGGYSSP